MGRELGFSVSCYRGDLPLLGGCLESIRHYAPDAPICLIAHGDFSTRSYEDAYGLKVIRREDVVHPDLRRLSFGFGLTKMIAFWEAPFEYVFHIDADAVLWGDVRKNLPPGDWDIVHNEPHEEITPFIQRTQYFDPDRIFEFIPKFPWENNPYFQAGVVCVRRGALDVEEYVEMLKLQQKHPEVFINGDQGILNILTFRASRAGHLTAVPAHLQTVVPVVAPDELEQRFSFGDAPPEAPDSPTVVHWAGPKPYRDSDELLNAPMNYFRTAGLQRRRHPLRHAPRLALAYEEWASRKLPATIRRGKEFVKSLIRPLGYPR